MGHTPLSLSLFALMTWAAPPACSVHLLDGLRSGHPGGLAEQCVSYVLASQPAAPGYPPPPIPAPRTLPTVWAPLPACPVARATVAAGLFG